MSKSKTVFLNGIIAVLGKIIGLIVVLFGIYIIIHAVLYSDTEHSFAYFSLAYFIIILGLSIFMLSINSNVSGYSEISRNGFFINAIFPFGLLFSFILKINTYISLFETDDIGNICLISQAIIIGIWFAQKAIKKKTWQEIELMRLDLYSTISMIPLTLIWVIFDIRTIKIGFALILGEFLIIQFMIKLAQIKIKEQDNNDDSQGQI